MHVYMTNKHGQKFEKRTMQKNNINWEEKGNADNQLERIHSISGFSVKFECRTLPTLSTMAEVVMDDSMHKMAVMASN